MSGLRAICTQCKKEFAPLSSARGEEADTCLTCLSYNRQQTNAAAVTTPTPKPMLTGNLVKLIYNDTHHQPAQTAANVNDTRESRRRYQPNDKIINKILKQIRARDTISRKKLLLICGYGESTLALVTRYLKDHNLITSIHGRNGREHTTTFKAVKQ